MPCYLASGENGTGGSGAHALFDNEPFVATYTCRMQSKLIVIKHEDRSGRDPLKLQVATEGPHLGRPKPVDRPVQSGYRLR